jgi:hypothetical protein
MLARLGPTVVRVPRGSDTVTDGDLALAGPNRSASRQSPVASRQDGWTGGAWRVQ